MYPRMKRDGAQHSTKDGGGNKTVKQGINDTTKRDIEDNANNDITALYLEHVKDAERECTEAERNGQKAKLARLTEHVCNLREPGLDGFIKFREYGNYSFVTLCSEMESSDSDEDSIVSALSSGG